MGYVAAKYMRIAGKGEIRPGEPIPEAASLPHIASLIRTYYVMYIPDGKEDDFRKCLLAGLRPRAIIKRYGNAYNPIKVARMIARGQKPSTLADAGFNYIEQFQKPTLAEDLEPAPAPAPEPEPMPEEVEVKLEAEEAPVEEPPKPKKRRGRPPKKKPEDEQ